MFSLLTIVGIVSALFHGFSEEGVDQVHQSAYEIMDNNPDRAVMLADSALHMSDALNYKWGVANSYFIKAYVYYTENEFDEAFLYCLKSNHVLNELNDEKSVKTNIDVLLLTGSLLRRNHKYDEAISFYHEGLAHADVKKYPHKRLQLLYNMASALHDKGDLPAAMGYLDQALYLANYLESDRLYLKCLNLLGIVYKESGDFKRARIFYSKIIEHPSADIERRAKAYHNIGITYMKMSAFDSAKYFLEEAALRDKLNNEHFLFITLKELSRAHIALENWDDALKYALEAEKHFPSVYHEPETFEIYHLLHTIYSEKGDYSLATGYANLYSQEVTKFYDQQKQLIALNDQFKTDLILAGFYQELEDEQRINSLWQAIYFIILIGMFASGFFYYKKVRMKRIMIEAIGKLKLD